MCNRFVSIRLDRIREGTFLWSGQVHRATDDAQQLFVNQYAPAQPKDYCMSASTNNTNDQATHHTIRCGQGSRYAFFYPLQQQLIIADADSKIQIELGFSPSRLLEVLISRANTIITRGEIMDYAWPDRIVTPNSLNQAISSLRELLGDEKDKRIIQTIPRRGYLFNAEHLPPAEEVPVTIESAAKTEPPPLTNTLRPRWIPLRAELDGTLTAVLTITLLIMLGTLIYRIDWKLIFQPELAVDTQQAGTQTLIYTAPDPDKVHILEDETVALRERLLKHAEQSDTLILNRVRDYYEINCIDRDDVAEFIYVHSSQLHLLTDQQLLECLR